MVTIFGLFTGHHQIYIIRTRDINCTTVHVQYYSLFHGSEHPYKYFWTATGTKNLPYEQSAKRKTYISGHFCYLIARDVPHSSSSWPFDHITSGKEHKLGGVYIVYCSSSCYLLSLGYKYPISTLSFTHIRYVVPSGLSEIWITFKHK